MMKVIWPNKFDSMFKDKKENLDRAKRVWVRHLPDDLTGEMIEQAFKLCHQELVWPPELKEFLDRCYGLSMQNGLPLAHAAYVECCEKRTPKDLQKWSHPVVYHTGVTIGWHRLHSTEERFVYPAFKTAYEKNVALLQRGAHAFQMPNRKKIESAPLGKPVSKEVARQYCNEILKNLELG